MNTIWKSISGLEGFYEVSNTGEVRSLDRIVLCKNPRSEILIEKNFKGQNITPKANPSGHLTVSLPPRHGQRRVKKNNPTAYVHILVLEAFVGPCPEGMVCRHLNGKPNDNRLENLQWGTYAENSKDTWDHWKKDEIDDLRKEIKQLKIENKLLKQKLLEKFA